MQSTLNKGVSAGILTSAELPRCNMHGEILIKPVTLVYEEAVDEERHSLIKITPLCAFSMEYVYFAPLTSALLSWCNMYETQMIKLVVFNPQADSLLCCCCSLYR